MRITLPRRRVLAASLTAGALAVTGTLTGVQHFAPRFSPMTAGASGVAPTSPPAKICGQPVLNSPWSYNGTAGTYTTSGTPAGLPTFGSAGTDFPSATEVIVVAAGDNTTQGHSGAWNVANAIIYFEPGLHTFTQGDYTGHQSAYVGGYTAGTGGAILDGGNTAPGPGFSSTTGTGSTVADTWEYLTIRNFQSSHNNSVMGNINGGKFDDGDVYKYDTIGPNEASFDTSSVSTLLSPGQGGGYAIGFGNYTTIEYDCLTQNAQGGFNGSGIGITISNNEISQNGLGSYPDTSGAGSSPYSCGCSGGGKLFWTVNADVTGNWVHDNYNTGIWFDFDSTGADISHNYVSYNWGEGIAYEADYNAVISDNTLIGNGWASDGPWPAGVGGGACTSGVTCTNGFGPTTGAGGGNPYAAIDLSDSGGNATLSSVSIPSNVVVPGCASSCTANSRYAGHIYVQGNVLRDNFGGVKVYTDTDRYADNIDNDSACSPPLGSLNQSNSTTYYRQTKFLNTPGNDAAISGSAVTTSVGTKTLCGNYGGSGADAPQQIVSQAPDVGMAVFDENANTFLGNIATVTSATAFTLDRSPGNATGRTLLISAYGGCGPADYWQSAQGVQSGTPAAYYWDNCEWNSKNITVSGNTFAINAAVMNGCTVVNMCGFMANEAFNAGVPALVTYWQGYHNSIANATGGYGNVWSNNAYTWVSGTGTATGWSFWAASQGNQVTQAAWQAAPYGQDAGSTFG